VYECVCDVNEEVGMYKGQDLYVVNKVYRVMLKDEGEGGSFQR
jgi:hypothetical protein